MISEGAPNAPNGEGHAGSGKGTSRAPSAAPHFTIGGSEIAAAAGIHPYVSQVQLWAQKTGRMASAETEAMEWGKRLEPLVVAQLESRGREVAPAPSDGFADPEYPWLVGHPDGFTVAHNERAILEVKTAGERAWPKAIGDGAVPVQYQAQAQMYMHLAELRFAVVACLVGGQRLEVVELRRNDQAVALLRRLAADFYEHLRTDTPPAPDGSSSAHDTVAALYPEHAPRKVHRLSQGEWRLWRELKARKAQLAAVKEQVTELENVLKAAMGEAETAISPHDAEAIHWRSVESRRLDGTALREARPEMWEEFVTITSARRFTLL